MTICWDSIDIIISWCPIFVIWTKWYRASCSPNLTNSSSIPPTAQSTSKLLKKPPSNISILQKLFSIPLTICIRLKIMDHWANLLIRRSISSKSAKKTMLKRSNNLSKKEAFWQEKESPILIIAHPNWIYLRSGSKNTFITTSPAKLSTWTEQISRTFLKA